MRLKGEPRKQEKGPTILGLFNKITERQTLPKGKIQTGRIKRLKKKMQVKADSNVAGAKEEKEGVEIVLESPTN